MKMQPGSEGHWIRIRDVASGAIRPGDAGATQKRRESCRLRN